MTAVGNKIDDKKSMRVSDVIAQTLIGDIQQGKLSIDSMLPTERELCDRFNASRPTVREALTQMQLRGFLTTETGKRPRVTKPSIESILLSAGALIRDVLGSTENNAHLEQMRQFIETGAVRETAKRGDNIQMARLLEALEKNFEAIGTKAFAETDIFFHRCLVSVVGNPILLKLHDIFVSPMIANRPPKNDQVKYDKISYEEHRAIYEAVLHNDAGTAAELMDNHLARAYRDRLIIPKVDG